MTTTITVGKKNVKTSRRSDQLLRPTHNVKRIPVLTPANRRGMEPKYVDYTQTIAISTSTTFALLNATLPGAEYYQRIGNSILMHHLQVKMYVEPFYYATNTFWDIFRVSVIFDRQPNGAFPVITDIYQDRLANGTAPTPDVLAGTNPVNSERFKILRKEIKYVPQTNLSSAIGPQYIIDPNTGKLCFEFFIPLKGLETRYNTATSGTITDINSGAIILEVTSDKVPSSITGNNIFVVARLKFTD